MMAGIVNIGEAGALALHVMVELAVLQEQDPAGRRTVFEMALRLQVSVYSLYKIITRLIALGFIQGSRGSKGGVALAMNQSDITLLQIIEGIDGRKPANSCLLSDRACAASGPCVFEGITMDMERTIYTYLIQTTVADIRDRIPKRFVEDKGAHP